MRRRGSRALASLQFLYHEVLGLPLEIGDEIVRAKRPHRVPDVLSRAEVAAVLSAMTGVPKLVASMLYGSGLRIGECLSLRVKDVDLAERVLVVRGGKGAKDRRTILSDSVVDPIVQHWCACGTSTSVTLPPARSWCQCRLRCTEAPQRGA